MTPPYASIVGKSDQWNQLKSAIYKRISRVSNDSPSIITRSGAARACRSHCNPIQRRRRRRRFDWRAPGKVGVNAIPQQSRYRAISEPGWTLSPRTETHFLVTADTRYVDFDDHRWLYHRLADWLGDCLRHDVHSVVALRSDPIRSDQRSDVRKLWEHYGEFRSRPPTTGRSWCLDVIRRSHWLIRWRVTHWFNGARDGPA